MGKILKEKSGNRQFQRGAWNLIDYTIITRKSIYAPYTDNYDSEDSKLFLTYAKSKGKIVPLNRFTKLDKPIRLDDCVILDRIDKENNIYAETDSSKEHIRFYTEVI